MFGRALALAVVVLVADRVSKHAVVTGIRPGDVERFLPGVQLVHDRNSGVAFSVFAGGGGLVLALTLAAMVALVVCCTLTAGRPGLWVPTGLLVGGAVGTHSPGRPALSVK